MSDEPRRERLGDLVLVSMFNRWHLSRAALPTAVIAAAALLLISEAAYNGAGDRLTRVVAMARAKVDMLQVLRRTNEAESAKRGYILAGGAEYLDPYRNAQAEVQALLGGLETHFQTLGDAQGRAMMARLRGDVDGKFAEMGEVLRVHDSGKPAQALEIIRSGIGRELMESIRRDVDGLIAYQNERIAEGMHGVYDTLQFNRIGVATMTSVSLLLMTLFLRLSRHLADEQEARQIETRAERDRLESEVERRTADLTELARHLQTAREDERSRLARDLHDELGALLTTAKLDAARIKLKLLQVAPDLVPLLGQLNDSLNDGIALKRRIIEDLRPSTLSNLGPKAALDILCSEFAERSNVPVQAEIDCPPLSDGLGIAVYRMVQEALTNIGKYAHAKQAWVTVKPDGDRLFIEVHDDGVGFDPAQVGHSGHSGHGLLGMRFRIQAARGELRIHSAPGQGTRLIARIPLPGRAL